MKKLYEEYLEKGKEFSSLTTKTDEKINDYIKIERQACKDKFKELTSKKDRVNFLICFENVEAKGLQERIEFLETNIRDCGDDKYCSEFLKEEIVLTKQRIEIINKRTEDLRNLL